MLEKLISHQVVAVAEYNAEYATVHGMLAGNSIAHVAVSSQIDGPVYESSTSNAGRAESAVSDGRLATSTLQHYLVLYPLQGFKSLISFK